ncbi:MAG: hypothetical protein ABR569_14725 [Gaiellaceae bacterium]
MAGDAGLLRNLVERWAAWVAGAVLVAGIALVLVGRLTGGSSSAAAGKPAPLAPAAGRVARLFVESAVARRNLARSYSLVTPTLRQGMSRAEWLSGTIPVVPYPVSQAVPRYQVEGSYTDHALLEVTFYPRPKSSVRSEAFLLSLARDNGRWLVSAWSARSVVGAPAGK